MPSALEIAALRWRARLLAQERAPMLQMMRVWRDAWDRLEREIADYSARIEAGDPLRPGLLYRREMAGELQRLIAAELERLAAAAGGQAVSLQREAVSQAFESVQEMVAAQSRQVALELRRPSMMAVEALIGYANEGTPLREVLTSASAGRAEQMAAVLAQNVALGVNPDVTTRQLRQQFETTLTQAQTIARSETLRAYRTASQLTMQANEDVIDGWIRIEACDDRTCAACWALHGTFYRLREAAAEHPNGRMVLAPRVRGAAVNVTPGAERFAELSAEKQRAILGKAKYQAYVDGALRLTPSGEGSVVGRAVSPRWGASIGVRSLRAIVGEEIATKYAAKARSG